MPMNGKYPLNRNDPTLSHPEQAIGAIDRTMEKLSVRITKLIEKVPAERTTLEATLHDARALAAFARNAVRNGGDINNPPPSSPGLY